MTLAEDTTYKRSGEMLMYDVLSFCGGSLKTNVTEKTGAAFETISALLENLTTGNFLVYDENNRTYPLTIKGKAFIKNYQIENRVLTTGGSGVLTNGDPEDPYNDSLLTKQLESSASSLKSIVEKTKNNATLTALSDVRRGTYQIIQDILERSVHGERMSIISKYCNLTYEQLKHYLFNLQNTNMILQKDKLYFTKPKGEFFIQSHRLQTSFMKTGNENDPYLDHEILAQIEAALSPIIKVRLLPSMHFITALDIPVIGNEKKLRYSRSI